MALAINEDVSTGSGATATETKPETAKKPKLEKTGNLIVDIAHEVESMSKTQALNQAEKLAETVEVTYFKLGGVLQVISNNGWYEGYPSFDDFVFEKYGFQARKARYLISIYDNLVTKQIPWEKVEHLGWTKLKDLAPILTPENVDEWVKKAENCTVVELLAMIQATKPGEEGEKASKTTDDVVVLKFRLHQNQADIVNNALAKAKGELKTDHDTVAIEQICAGYVGGNSAVALMPSIDDLIESYGFEPLLTRISEKFPQYDINVTEAKAAEQTASASA